MPLNNIVVIPAYNAEATLGAVLDSVRAYSERVLVVNDGSRDATQEVIKAYPWVESTAHEVNRGKGAALETGLQFAAKIGCATAITLDADGQHAPEEIPAFLEEYAKTGSKIIIGARFDNAPGEGDRVPLHRLLANRISSGLLTWRIGARVLDSQSGYRLYDLSVVELFGGMNPGFAWETQILVRAARRKFNIAHIPIACRYPDGTRTSHYRSVHDSLEILKVILFG